MSDDDKHRMIRCNESKCDKIIGVGFAGNYTRWDNVWMKCLNCYIKYLEEHKS